jgi:hypothetical protein
MVATAHAIINDDRHDNGTTVVFAVSILPVATPRARSYVLEPMPRIRFNDTTPDNAAGAAYGPHAGSVLADLFEEIRLKRRGLPRNIYFTNDRGAGNLV